MERAKGIFWAALLLDFRWRRCSPPLLLGAGYSLVRGADLPLGRGVAVSGSLRCRGRMRFRLGRKELRAVFLLSLFRAATSFSLVIAYRNIASGVASTIHFMYPLAVALAMICFFRERGIGAYCRDRPVDRGAVLLSSGNVGFHAGRHPCGHDRRRGVGLPYAGYIVGVPGAAPHGRLHGAHMLCDGFRGAVFPRRRVADGRRPDRDGPPCMAPAFPGWRFRPRPSRTWRFVQAIRRIGPDADLRVRRDGAVDGRGDGVTVFAEPFTAKRAAGILLIVAAVSPTCRAGTAAGCDAAIPACVTD